MLTVAYCAWCQDWEFGIISIGRTDICTVRVREKCYFNSKLLTITYFHYIKMREGYHFTALCLLGYHAVSLAHLGLGIFSHLCLQKLSSSQVVWRALMCCYFQLWDLVGALKDSYRLVLKPLSHCFEHS